MNSKGHVKVMEKAIEIFNNTFPDFKIVEKQDIENILKGVVDPDYINKSKGSHYAIYDKTNDTFNNRIKKNKENAYTNLIKYFDYAVQNNDIYYLGFALHFVMDMLTIPHATGIKIAPLFYFGSHRRYERYTTKNIDKYLVNNVDITDLAKKDVKTIFKANVDLINSYKTKLNKKYYDEINNQMIPLMLKYTVYFMYLYFNERSK